MLLSVAAMAHDVAKGDKAYVQSINGPAFMPFMYLGTKHMVTGYDHILFLIGVVFFLYRLKDVVLYVSMFTIGHSTTLLLGVLLGTGANSYTSSTRSSVSRSSTRALRTSAAFTSWASTSIPSLPCWPSAYATAWASPPS